MLLATSEFPLEQKDAVFGMTPLLLASYRGHKMVVKKLLGAGAYPLVTCKKGKSPLDYATTKDHKAVITMLEKAVRAALTPEEEQQARFGAVILLVVAGIFCAWQFWESRKMVAPPLTKREKEKAKEEKERKKKETLEKEARRASRKKEKESAKKEKKEEGSDAKKDE
jgi:hypothetical protein